MHANDAGAEAGRRLPGTQPQVSKRIFSRFHGNQFTRRNFLRALLGAESYRQAVRLAGVESDVAFRELQNHLRETGVVASAAKVVQS